MGEADTACLAIMGEIQGRSGLFYSYNINPNIIMGEIQGRFYNDMNKDFKGHGFDDCCNCCVSFILTPRIRYSYYSYCSVTEKPG